MARAYSGCEVLQQDFLKLDLPGTKLVVGDGPTRSVLMRKFANAIFLGAQHGEVLADFGGKIRVGVTGAGPCAFRAVNLEQALNAKLVPQAVDAVEIDYERFNSDLHATAEFRANLVRVMARRAVAALRAVERHQKLEQRHAGRQDRELVPGTTATKEELLGIGRAMGRVGYGVFEMASDLKREWNEFEWMGALSRETGLPVTFAALQSIAKELSLEEQIALMEQENAKGGTLVAQIALRVSHGLVDRSIVRSRDGVRTVAISLLVLVAVIVKVFSSVA